MDPFEELAELTGMSKENLQILADAALSSDPLSPEERERIWREVREEARITMKALIGLKFGRPATDEEVDRVFEEVDQIKRNLLEQTS